MSELVRIDVPVNPLPHVCLHVNIPGRGGRVGVSKPEKLADRRQFREDLKLVIPKRARRGLTGALSVRVLLWHRGTRVADGDNLQKELFDALTEAGVWADDRLVRDCHWTVVGDGPRVNPRIVVEIRAYSEQLVSSPTHEGASVSP